MKKIRIIIPFVLLLAVRCSSYEYFGIKFDYNLNGQIPIANFSETLKFNCSAKSISTKADLTNTTFQFQFGNELTQAFPGYCVDKLCYYEYKSTFNKINNDFNLNFTDLESLQSKCIIRFGRDGKTNFAGSLKVIPGLIYYY